MDVELQKAEIAERSVEVCPRILGLYAYGEDKRDNIIYERLRDRYVSKFNLSLNTELEKQIFSKIDRAEDSAQGRTVFSFGNSACVDFNALKKLLPDNERLDSERAHFEYMSLSNHQSSSNSNRVPTKPHISSRQAPPPLPTTTTIAPSHLQIPTSSNNSYYSNNASVALGKRKSESELEDEREQVTRKGNFQTARDKYVDDCVKKGTQPKASTLPVKKTLGTRPSRKAFVVPLKKEEEEEEEVLFTSTAPAVKRVAASAITNPASKNTSKPTNDPENPNGIESINGVPLTDDRLRNSEPRMLELICNEILDKSPSVQWDDIAGLQFAKSVLREVIMWPSLRPDLFRTRLRQPPRGLLLFGPPGTGKTLIGKAIASESESTFFCISASSLTSKWIGDGEKMVRALFSVASCYSPAVIFVDEIDSLLTQRSENENEATRRLKTEFLIQWDGANTSIEQHMLLVGATNRPQELDEAARRRFAKRISFPSP